LSKYIQQILSFSSFDKYDLQILNQSNGKVGWSKEPQPILIVVLFLAWFSVSDIWVGGILNHIKTLAKSCSSFQQTFTSKKIVRVLRSNMSCHFCQLQQCVFAPMQILYTQKTMVLLYAQHMFEVCPIVSISLRENA
jgi:hypothetical protein